MRRRKLEEDEKPVPTYNSLNFTRIRYVKKTRVDSTCEMCGVKINKGESCQYWSGLDFGNFFYFRVCNNCGGE